MIFDAVWIARFRMWKISMEINKIPWDLRSQKGQQLLLNSKERKEKFHQKILKRKMWRIPKEIFLTFSFAVERFNVSINLSGEIDLMKPESWDKKKIRLRFSFKRELKKWNWRRSHRAFSSKLNRKSCMKFVSIFTVNVVSTVLRFSQNISCLLIHPQNLLSFQFRHKFVNY